MEEKGIPYLQRKAGLILECSGAFMLDHLTFHYFPGTKVGDILDRQHLEIKRRHQNLKTAILEGSGMDQIIACSKELIATSLLHFESKESAKDAHKQWNFTAHKRIDADMIKHLKVISSDLEKRRISGAMELLKFFEGQPDPPFGCRGCRAGA